MKNIKKFDYTETLGWSISRYEKFLNCKRQYFYDYYSKFDDEIPYEKIQFLKNLTSKPLEIGNIVHDIMKSIFKRYQKNIKPINKDKFFQYSLKITKEHCHSKIFFEHYYNGEIILPLKIYEKIKKILENFLNSKRFVWITKNAISKNDEWIIEPDGFGEFRIKNYKAFCKVDLLLPALNNIYIIDWKTGKPNKKKHSKQLTGYAFWASYHFKKKSNNIIPIAAYLYPKYEEKNIEIFDDSITEFENIVVREIEDMYKYLTNIEKNIPKNKESFHFTGNIISCKYCNYKEICYNKNKIK
ncbi:MAG: PD-(D/E)XK nuclease family protein [Endomicrobium sp.]|jgi:CRISPR/Cas system-associated exonuclease Cas4 (RecB family)|nr:PD-(D/E)XK nuclease family protein [Endomicrobium sp.]